MVNNRNGIVHSMSAEEYHNGPEHSNSGLHILATKTPAHYDLYRNGLLKKSTPSLELGTNVHVVLLEPNRFEKEYLPGPDVRRNSKKWKNFELENPGKIILKQGEYDLLIATRRRVFDSCASARWLLQQRGESEVSVFWQDEMTGLECRCRPDRLIPYSDKMLIVDVKTCRDASPQGFEKSVRNYGYDRNCAFYRRGVESASELPTEFFFLAIETPGMVAAVYQIDEDDQIRANVEIDDLLYVIMECEDAGIWPGYSDKITTIKKRNHYG